MSSKSNYRKVMALGHSNPSLVVCLTPELRALGFKKGDTVHIYLNGNNIILSRNPTDSLKPTSLDEETWRDLQALVIKMDGHLDKLGQRFKEAIELYINEKNSLWAKIMHKTIIKTGGKKK